MANGLNRRPLIAAGTMLGIGMGGFVDGIVFHGIKSCRTTSTGLSEARRVLSEQRGIPSLLLESDMMDRRVVSEAQIKNRVDAFFEGLVSRRLAQSGA